MTPKSVSGPLSVNLPFPSCSFVTVSFSVGISLPRLSVGIDVNGFPRLSTAARE